MALSDVVKPRLTELGKIKIGGKSPDVRKTANGAEWRAPVKFDHFLITTLDRSPSGDLLTDKALMEVLAHDFADDDGKIRRLPIAVLSNEIEDIMQASYVWYVGKRVAARSDGKILTKFYDGKEWLAQPVQTEWHSENLGKRDARGNRFFKVHATFNCAIAIRNSKWGGVYKFRTTSQITASQLYGSLIEVKQLTGSILRGIPLRLVIRPMQVTPDGKPTTVHVVHCELVGDDLLSIQRMAMERASQELLMAKTLEKSRIEYRRLLTAPGYDETPQEQADIAEEFQPEVIEATDVPTADPLMAQMGLQAPAPEPAKETAPPDSAANDDGLPNELDDYTPSGPDLEEELRCCCESIEMADGKEAMESIWNNVKAAGYGPWFESAVLVKLQQAGYDPLAKAERKKARSSK